MPLQLSISLTTPNNSCIHIDINYNVHEDYYYGKKETKFNQKGPGRL